MNRISAERRSATPGIKKTYCKYIGVTDTAALSNAQGKQIPRGPSFQEPQTQQNRLNTLALIPAENKI
jgi:hypothetical protein